jgi:hypothetical protein
MNDFIFYDQNRREWKQVILEVFTACLISFPFMILGAICCILSK